MIYLDTHVVVWLYAGLLDKISNDALNLMETNELLISPMVQLELTYLHEIKKITIPAQPIVHELQKRLGLKVCDLDFCEVINKAEALNFTRDPFDRLIIAQAMCQSAKLVTKDKIIRKHYKLAYWD